MAKAETLLGFSGRSKPETVPDSESDSDQEENHGGATGTGQAAGSLTRVQVIHSGHFMVSSPHSDSTSRRKRHGVNFDTVNRTGCQTYRFGPRSMGSLSIDPTLTRLFECMTLAYRDKIRLNNGIWRAWYIQYVEKRKNPVCGFVTPLEGSEADTHRKPEAIVLEGNYWKRRIEVVIKEYHKWRIYHKKRMPATRELVAAGQPISASREPQRLKNTVRMKGYCRLAFQIVFCLLLQLHKNKDGHLSALAKEDIYRDSVKKWTNQMFQDPVPMEEEEGHLFDLDCFLSDISDTLFTMTQNPCLWQEVRENAYTSNADMIQPGLTPLQPNLDDFMDIPDIFMNHRNPPQGQAGSAECGYLPTMSSSVFSSGPSSVQTGCQLQANAMSDSTGRLPLPSTSDCVSDDGYHGEPLSSEITYDQSSLNSEAKYKAQVHYGHQPEFFSADLRPESDPYGSYRNPPTMTPPNITGINQDCCYAYSAQSHKYSQVMHSSLCHRTSLTGDQLLHCITKAHLLSAHIFMNHRNPPQGQAGSAECGYLPTMSSSVFSSGPSSVQTGCQLQANAMSDSTGRLPLPSTSDCVSDDGYHGEPLSSEITYDQSSLNSEAKYKAQVHYGHQPEFFSADLRPESDPYGSYRNPQTMTPPNITGINQDCCYAYSAQSHKYRYNSPVTSSVITHTGSMSGPQDLPGSSYPSPGVFPSSVSASLVYPCPSNMQAAQPVLGAHAFSMPRGRSQTTGGLSKEKTSSIKPKRSLSFSAPLQSSCLAKLLSTDIHQIVTYLQYAWVLPA
ncbi:UNVERIFIED_CONTAM: hypothetical protein FKN15_037816 [Acipenser sinensis]